MKKGSRKNHSAAYKAKVALEAAHGTRTTPRRTLSADWPAPSRTGVAKKSREVSLEGRRAMIDPDAPISVRQQCTLLGLHRSGLYHVPAQESAVNLNLMRRIDKIYTAWPFYGFRKIAAELRREGHDVNRKRTQRLMRLMGLEAIYPKPKTSKPVAEHRIYPYLLRNVSIEKPDHVWSSDITYLPMRHGFLFLAAVIDWFSRYVLSWELSNTLDATFCVRALTKALARETPDIFNTDQGAQFTANDSTDPLKAANIQISMDGKGRALDNVFIERLWRSVKYECISTNTKTGTMRQTA